MSKVSGVQPPSQKPMALDLEKVIQARVKKALAANQNQAAKANNPFGASGLAKPQVKPMHAQNAHGDVFVRSAQAAAKAPAKAPLPPTQTPAVNPTKNPVMQSLAQLFSKLAPSNTNLALNKNLPPKKPEGLSGSLLALGALGSLGASVAAPAAMVAQPNLLNQLIGLLPK